MSSKLKLFDAFPVRIAFVTLWGLLQSFDPIEKNTCNKRVNMEKKGNDNYTNFVKQNVQNLNAVKNKIIFFRSVFNFWNLFYFFNLLKLWKCCWSLLTIRLKI